MRGNTQQDFIHNFHFPLEKLDIPPNGIASDTDVGAY